MKRKTGFEASVSLFPFLDVLICTMGALILALVVSVLDAAAAARRTSTVPPAADESLAERRGDLQLRIEQLDSQRKANLADLETERQGLAHIEAHLRTLREQLEAARGEAANLAKAAANALSDRALLQKRLAELAQEIKRLEALLASQQRQLSTARPAYSVVPYVGPNGTRRRPIYIECRGDRVVLQPEGIELGADDFDGPLGPGNPLATAVRAACDAPGTAADAGAAPYPFLLVRPDGIEAYAAARAALKSWGSDFGYELIDDDWDLALPQRNPVLAQRIEAEVADARERQRILADSVPRARGSEGGRPMFRADPVRGIVQVGGGHRRGSPSNGGGFSTGGPNGGGGQSDNPYGNSALPGAGHGGRHGGSGTGGLDESNTTAAGLPRDGASEGEAGPGGGYGAPGRGAPGSAFADDASGPVLADGSTGQINSGAGQSGAGGQASAPSATAGTPSGRGTLGNKSPGDIGAELARERAAESGGGSGFGGEPRLAAGGGRSQPGAPPSMSPNGMTSGQPGGSAQGQMGTGEAPKLGEYVERPPRDAELAGGAAADHAAKPVKSLSEKRGRDWALPEQTRSATPITRPIRLELGEASLRVIDDDGVSTRKNIALENSTIDAVDDLVSTIWDAIRDWGIAGRGQYWRPVLLIDVAPGAERRYAELQGLLADSGLEVRPRLAERPSGNPR